MKKNSLYDLLTNPYVILVLLLILCIFNSLFLSINYDEHLWSYIGRIWNRHGIPPYVGAVENKTPGIFILYAISDFLLEGNIFFIRFIGVFSTLFSAWLLYKICLKLYDKLAGIFCMILFGLSTCWYLLDGYCFSHPEVFMVLFSVLALYFILKSNNIESMKPYLFLAGMSIGMAISFKQIALTTFLALILFFLLYTANGFLLKNKIRGVFLFLLGCLASMALSYLILCFNGVSLYDYFEGAWLILLNSGSKAPNFKVHIDNFWNNLIASKFVIFYLFIALFFFQKQLQQKPFFWGIVLFFVLDFVGVNASGYYYGHQIKQVIPSLSIIAGIVMSNLKTNNFYLKMINPKLSIYIIVILFFPYKQTYLTTKYLLNPPDSSSKELSSWIRDNTNEADFIYILGGDEKLVDALSESGRVSSSKYFNSIFITEDKYRKVIYSDLVSKPPKVILKLVNDSIYVHQVYGSEIEGFLKKEYNFYEIINGIEIYKLNRKG